MVRSLRKRKQATINCRHLLFPFVEGVNENNQRQYSEDEMTEGRENRQKQRYHERQIRQAKRELNIAKETGDVDSIQRKTQLVRDRQKRTREFIAESGRTRQYDREKVH